MPPHMILLALGYSVFVVKSLQHAQKLELFTPFLSHDYSSSFLFSCSQSQ